MCINTWKHHRKQETDISSTPAGFLIPLPRVAITLIAILYITFVYMIGQDEEDFERGKGGWSMFPYI